MSDDSRPNDLGRDAAARLRPQHLRRPSIVRAHARVGAVAAKTARFAQLAGRSLVVRRVAGQGSTLDRSPGSTAALPTHVPRAALWYPLLQHRRAAEAAEAAEAASGTEAGSVTDASPSEPMSSSPDSEGTTAHQLSGGSVLRPASAVAPVLGARGLPRVTARGPLSSAGENTAPGGVVRRFQVDVAPVARLEEVRAVGPVLFAKERNRVVGFPRPDAAAGGGPTPSASSASTTPRRTAAPATRTPAERPAPPGPSASATTPSASVGAATAPALAGPSAEVVRRMPLGAALKATATRAAERVAGRTAATPAPLSSSVATSDAPAAAAVSSASMPAGSPDPAPALGADADADAGSPEAPRVPGIGERSFQLDRSVQGLAGIADQAPTISRASSPIRRSVAPGESARPAAVGGSLPPTARSSSASSAPATPRSSMSSVAPPSSPSAAATSSSSPSAPAVHSALPPLPGRGVIPGMTGRPGELAALAIATRSGIEQATSGATPSTTVPSSPVTSSVAGGSSLRSLHTLHRAIAPSSAPRPTMSSPSVASPAPTAPGRPAGSASLLRRSTRALTPDLPGPGSVGRSVVRRATPRPGDAPFATLPGQRVMPVATQRPGDLAAITVGPRVLRRMTDADAATSGPGEPRAGTPGAARAPGAAGPSASDVSAGTSSAGTSAAGAPASRASTPAGQQFLSELARHPSDSIRPLPPQYEPLARAIAGPRPIAIRTGAATRKALAAVRKQAATVDNVIHLPDAPAVRTPSPEIVAHELVHAARPSPEPRFFDDDHHSAEEALAHETGRLLRAVRSPSDIDVPRLSTSVPSPPVAASGTGAPSGATVVRRSMAPPTRDLPVGTGAPFLSALGTQRRDTIRRLMASEESRTAGPAGGAESGPASPGSGEQRTDVTAPAGTTGTNSSSSPPADPTSLVPVPAPALAGVTGMQSTGSVARLFRGESEDEFGETPRTRSLLEKLLDPAATGTPDHVTASTSPSRNELIERIVDAIEERVIDELERRGRRHHPGVF